MNAVLEVHDLVVEYPQRAQVKRTIDGASVSLHAGEILGLVGQSGAGKSIFMRSLMNLVPMPGRISSGTITVFGEDILTMPDRRLRTLRGDRVGVIVQNARSHLNPLIRIGDQIANVYRAHNNINRKQANQLVISMLRDVGMPAAEQRFHAYPHELSGGMAQRAMIAMAMICAPELLIADEPTSGLDVTIQDQILKLFRHSVVERGASGLLITRDMGIVANFCDRVAVMYEGRIVELADVKVFFTQAEHAHSRALIAAAAYSSAQATDSAAAARALV